MKANALLDKDFLKRLDQERHKVIYVKIILLNLEGDPIKEIDGQISGGSINVDGKSCVRRTCNLDFITNENVDVMLQTRFSVSLGLQNKIDKRYEDIIWFPQGVYVTTAFSSTYNQQGYSIKITGKDKMCLINGDVSGQLFASHDFGKIYTTQRDGTIVKTDIPIRQIIKEAVHTYAQEPYSNIIINDLDTCGVELIDYTAEDSRMYIFEQKSIYNENDPWVQQICFQGSYMGNLFDNYKREHDDLNWDFTVNSNGMWYHLLKCIDPQVDYDTVAGYRATDLTYNEDLIIDIGGTITQMLDKLVKMLGDFEYFYNLEGKFVFQRKKIYLNTSWSNAITNIDETYYDSIQNSSANVYDFLSGYLVESFSNKPKLESIRNDYAVWGKRKTASGQEVPIHLRYALDARPTIYYSLLEKRSYMSNAYQFKYVTGWKKDSDGLYVYDDTGKPEYEYETVEGIYDWRELIYQMARDNLASTTRIFGLTKAMAQKPNPYYHYSYYKMERDKNYTQYLKYNDLKNKFEAIKRATKEELKDIYGYKNEDVLDAEWEYEKVNPGYHEFQVLKKSGVYLYGPDASLAEWTLTSLDITNVEYDMRSGRRFDNEGNEYYIDTVYPEYNYGYTDFNAQYYNFVYSHPGELDAAGERELQKLMQLQIDEQEVISHYTEANQLEDMRREIDAWQDTFNTGYDAYYADMLQFWPRLYRTNNVIEYMYDDDGLLELDESGNPKYAENSLSPEEWSKWQLNHFWNPDLTYYDPTNKSITFKNPELLYFWIDFAEQDNAPSLWKYSVPAIGRRSKSINDDQVKAIYFRDTPPLLFVSEDYEEVSGEENLAYVRIQLTPPISNYFKISAQGKSAKEALDSLMYEGTYYQDQITMTTIPIYYLEPNVRIKVQDDSTGIDGEYIIQSFSLQLKHDGMMSITASRAGERIL